MPPPHAAGPHLPDEVAVRLLTYLDETTDLVGVADEVGHVMYVNHAARRRLGLTESQASELTTADLFPPEAFDIYYEQVRPVVLRGEVWNGYVPVLGASGASIEMWATIVGEARPGGEVVWLVISARDVTEWRHVRDELSQRATHDDLTGLANRALLFDHLGIALARARRSGALVAVLFVDLDDLKAINDTYGHHAGDAVLVEVGNRLRDAVRAIDTVARVGGDEFVVLLDGVDDEAEAASLATRVNAAVEAQAVDTGEVVVNVSASMGVSVGRGDADGEGLLRRADAAMYEAKSDRRPADRTVPPIGHRDAASSPRLSPHDVAVAVTQRAIVPFRQPVVDLADGREVGLQLLARWLRPGADPIEAAVFVPVVDGSGVGFTLDLAMLRHAAAALPHAPAGARRWLSVHVSSRFLTRPGVTRFVREVLHRAHIEPGELRLVVPDEVVQHRRPLALDAMWQLRDLGAHITLGMPEVRPAEDLAALVDGIVEEARLGRRWAPTLTMSPADLTAMVAAAAGQGLTVRMAGIETEAQLEAARRLGVHHVEGLAIGPPTPLTA